jgi:pyruvate dehydrogenase E2 component (dihydrolipoamide acetyltransferase)
VTQSHREIPPINLAAQIDLSAVKEYRRRMQEENLRELSYDAFFVFAVARALKEFPHFRSRLEDEKTVTADAIHVGVAISAGEELFTPVVRQADTKSILDIDAEIRALAERVGKRTITAADMTGAVLTISNLGMYPIHSFAAVIPPGQAAALAIGCAEETPVVRNGSVKIVPLTTITLSVDHRLINGREAGQFIARLKPILEKL